MRPTETLGVTINAPRFALESTFTVSTLQQDLRSEAFTVCCKHCVTGGRHGPDFEHLLGDEEALPTGTVVDERAQPGQTQSQREEELRRHVKGVDVVDARQKRNRNRKLGRRP